MNAFPGYIRAPFYYETDKMGIIHHSNYIRWFEESRVALLEHLGFGFEKIEELGIVVPVLAVDSQYKEMVRFGDTVRIEPTITTYTGTRLTFSYRVVNTKTNRVTTTGSSSHCFLSAESGRLLRLSKSFPEVHQLFLAGVASQKGEQL